jgi:hypothetical protein
MDRDPTPAEVGPWTWTGPIVNTGLPGAFNHAETPTLSFTPQVTAEDSLEVLSGQRRASESVRGHELKPVP